jgi:uncharacterized pyridoxal phosphate-containing UPF0001 family protein
MTDVAARVDSVRARLAAAAARAGRDPSSVTLVAATKLVPAEGVAAALRAGVVDVGENRAQELLAKAPALEALRPRWHFLGPLQRNKVKPLAGWVTCWKAGCAPDEATTLVDALRGLGLDVAGLMAVPPHGEDPRPWFARLRALAAAAAVPELSMGMTDDFEIAVEEGATLVRVGRALFGERPQSQAPQQ